MQTRSDLPPVPADGGRLKSRAAVLSVISNSVLVTLKLTVGVATGSVSVLSEAIHSGMDLLAAIIAFFAVRTAVKPADKDHPFGHGKFENLSAAVEALLIVLAAAWIIYKAVDRLVHPAPLDLPGLGAGIMLLSAVVNIFVARYLFRTCKRSESPALEADAWHLLTDVYTSFGVMVGLLLIWGGERLFPGTHFHWIDPTAAIIVALLILKAAYDLIMKSAVGLLDTSLPTEEEGLIRTHIAQFSPEVRGFHRLRTRKAGAHRYVEFHMFVDGGMNVADSHAITDKVAQAIRDHFPETLVTIHIEPCDGRCGKGCAEDCLLPEPGRLEIRKIHAQP